MLIAIPATVAGQTPAATANADLPQGPLGEQIAWLVETLNADPATYDQDDIASHFAPAFLAELPADQLPPMFTQIQQQLGPSEIEPGPMRTSRDMPPTNARFVLAGETSIRVLVTINIERETGLIDDLFISPAPVAVASPVSNATVSDTDITFQSGDDTLYGSYMAPVGQDTPTAAALIISSSGPTDRNGNSPLIPSVNVNLNIATTLAASGIPSLRYDKLGSGETGLATHDPAVPVTFEIFLQEARDAAAVAIDQAGIDPGQLILVGHSEGALFALLLAQEMRAAGTPPAGLVLAAPISLRYLDVLADQVTRQYEAAVEAGMMNQATADEGIATLTALIETLRETGTLPDEAIAPELAPLFAPINVPFLVEADTNDPAELAAGLPADLPVLILHGGKDAQVFPEHIERLMTGFADHTAVTLVEIPDADHLLRTIEGDPNPAVDYLNPDLPFAPEAATAITEFAASLE